MRAAARRGGRCALLAAALACGALPLAAQANGCRAAADSSHAAWPAPLDRRVTVRRWELSLRDALDRISALAGVRLSYSSEQLPLDARVCVATPAGGEPLGAVLARLVSSAGAEPRVVAGQVVLAPALRARTAPALPREATPAVLERIVVTGAPAGAQRRELAVALGVVEGRDASRQSVASISGFVNRVAGVWAWDRSPSSLLARYGSMRGASSFGATVPKVYVDGIEVANPLLLNELDPDVIRRVEVIRGPQGAALYGSDAISGVVNIVTRTDAAGGSPARVELRGGGGMVQSEFAGHAVPTHEERVSLRGGSNLRSGGIGLDFRQTGELFPGADSRQLSATAGGRLVANAGIVSATARFLDKHTGAGANPLIAAVLPDTAADGSALPAPTRAARQSLQEYTAGVNATLGGQGRWTHTLILGADGYHLQHLANEIAPIPWSLERELGTASGAAARGTLRASSTARFGSPGDSLRGSLSLGVEESLLRQRSAVVEANLPSLGQQYGTAAQRSLVEWRNATGVLAQGSGAWGESFFLSGGVRLERNAGTGAAAELTTLPMLGAAVVRDLGGAEVKLRTAYGRGIRPPRSTALSHVRSEEGRLRQELDPEVQAGVELGAELYLPMGLSLQATRFDQRATGLIQQVLVRVDTVLHAGLPAPHAEYQLQNVGVISNQGWELEAAFRRGNLAVSGAWTQVDSRVRRVAGRYAGDLRAGDRALGVPAGTLSLSAGWGDDESYAGLTLARAWNWIDYDRLALAREFADSTSPHQGGAWLRNYWRTYHGHTDLGFTAARPLRGGLGLVVSADNLLGGQTGEPDNVTIRSGRTLSVSLRTAF